MFRLKTCSHGCLGSRCGFRPHIGRRADGAESVWDSLPSPLPGPSPRLVLELSLSLSKQVNIFKKLKKKHQEFSYLRLCPFSSLFSFSQAGYVASGSIYSRLNRRMARWGREGIFRMAWGKQWTLPRRSWILTSGHDLTSRPWVLRERAAPAGSLCYAGFVFPWVTVRSYLVVSQARNSSSSTAPSPSATTQRGVRT